MLFKTRNITLTRGFTTRPAFFSIFDRKQFNRRVHISKWLLFTRILTTWFSEYQLLRTTNNYTFTNFFFQKNLLVYNFTNFKHFKPAELLITEDYLITTDKRALNLHLSGYVTRADHIESPAIRNLSVTPITCRAARVNLNSISGLPLLKTLEFISLYRTLLTSLFLMVNERLFKKNKKSFKKFYVSTSTARDLFLIFDNPIHKFKDHVIYDRGSTVTPIFSGLKVMVHRGNITNRRLVSK